MADNDNQNSRVGWLGLAALALPVSLAVILGWYLLPSSSSSDDQEKKMAAQRPVQSPAYAYSPPLTLAVAQRRGRCRAMNHHLSTLAQAKDKSEVESVLRLIGLLAGEMMNGYPAGAVDTAGTDSRASQAIYTPEGRRGLLEARDGLREVVRTARQLDDRQAAVRVSESCAACHAQFVRDEGRGLLAVSTGNTE